MGLSTTHFEHVWTVNFGISFWTFIAEDLLVERGFPQISASKKIITNKILELNC